MARTGSANRCGLGQFNLYLFLYMVVSLVIFLAVAYTIPAFIVYVFLLLPFYGICLLAFGSVAFSQSRSHRVMIRYRRIALLPVIVFQVLTLLFSPSSCYGWKQGQACYSLIQTLFARTDLKRFDNLPPNWNLDTLFLVMVLLYAIAVVVFLTSVRFEPVNPSV